MRGSVYYQSAQLAKLVFEAGAKKEDRINPKHPHYQKVASYQTMESYRNVWNNFFNYLKEHWCIKDYEKISSEHITAYLDYKIEYYPSKQYLQKIVSAAVCSEWRGESSSSPPSCSFTVWTSKSPEPSASR
jgi:hypothetical protein